MSDQIYIPKAQEAYTNTIEKLSLVDTSDLMQKSSELISEAISQGRLVTMVGPIPATGNNALGAEKLAIQLEQLGYNATVTGVAPILQNGMSIPAVGVFVNWKYMPANTRETYN